MDAGVTVSLETRQITLDTGNVGANIIFRGQVDIEESLRDPNGADNINQQVSIEADANQLPHFVALNLAAGSGTIVFDQGIEGIAQRVTTDLDVFPSEGVTLDNFVGVGGKFSTNTVDLTISSGAGIAVGDSFKLFVNSFNNVANASVDLGDVETIFHQTFAIRDVNESFPPIFPEPVLPARGSARLGGQSIALAVLTVASAVEETQREEDTACGEDAAGEGEQGESAGDACASTAEAEELYAIESGPKEADPAPSR